MSKRGRPTTRGDYKSDHGKKSDKKTRKYDGYVKSVAVSEGGNKKDGAQILDVFNTNEASRLINSTGFIDLLNGCVIGNTVASREGLRIRMKSLYFKCIIDFNSAVAQDQGTVRISIIYDKRPAKVAGGATTLPSFTDIYGTVSQAGAVTGTTHPLAPIRADKRERFVTLMSETRVLPRVAATGLNDVHASISPLEPMLIERYVKLQNLPTLFNQNVNGDISDINEGALYLMVSSDQAANAYGLKYFSRLKFEK